MPRQRVGAGDKALVLPSAALRIKLLGGFKVRVGGAEILDSAWRLSKARSLLKLLALAPGHRLTRDQVLDQLWPDLDPGAAANNLHQTLHGLRRALTTLSGSAEVRLQHGLLILQPDDPLHLDVDDFEAAAERARRSDDPASYYTAIALYTGDLLPDDLYEDWAAGRREALRGTFLNLLLDLARRHEARGELKGAMEILRRAVDTEPTLEDAHVQLMRFYATTGQRVRALRQYAQLRATLAEQLETEPDAGARQLYAAILAGGSDAAEAAGEGERHVSQHNLPIALTSFIGREDDAARTRDLVAGARLVTLTGVGGTGKTRLALRVAWDVLDRYRDGVWLVDLAALVAGDLVPAATAGALGIAEQPGHPWTEALLEHLRGRHLLLILDNCEHVREECARLVTALLAGCAELQVLATSRSRLGVPGELTVIVEPLSLPERDDAGLDHVLHSDAVRLFVERARFRQPGFVLTPRIAPAIARICRRVEGIPLAIELAAARVGMLSVEQIAERLADAPRFLSGDDAVEARHRTLRAALDWSYDLLTEQERRLFRLLSVFDGGWSLEAAETLSAGGQEVDALHLLAGLVDKSLVVAEGALDDSVRYRMLEPVRQYARERLGEAGEEADARRRHAEMFTALAEKAEPEIRRADGRAWLDRLQLEHDNLRAALRWSLEQRAPLVGLRIASAIWRFWFARGHLHEGRAILRRLLSLAEESGAAPAPVLARAYNAAGAMAFFQTDSDEAIKRYEQARALYREIGDEQGLARVLSNLGLARKDRGERDLAAALLEEALGVQTRLGETVSMTSTLGNLGILAQEAGDYDRARTLHQRKLALARSTGVTGQVITALNNLGAIAVEQESLDEARSLLEESARLADEQGIKRSLGVAITNLGTVARKQGRSREAIDRYVQGLALARDQGEKAIIATNLEGLAATLSEHGQTDIVIKLFSAAEELRRSSNAPIPPADQEQYAAIIAPIRRSLGPAFDALWTEGSRADTDTIDRWLDEQVTAPAR